MDHCGRSPLRWVEPARSTSIMFATIERFVFYSCFAVNQWLLCWRVGPPRSWLYGDRVYVALSVARQVFVETRAG